jgi:hypothetical protein
VPRVEEFFLHLWDDFDDFVHTCRHLAQAAAAELLSGAAPLIAAASGALLAGAATLLLSRPPPLAILG